MDQAPDARHSTPLSPPTTSRPPNQPNCTVTGSEKLSSTGTWTAVQDNNYFKYAIEVRSLQGPAQNKLLGLQELPPFHAAFLWRSHVADKVQIQTKLRFGQTQKLRTAETQGGSSRDTRPNPHPPWPGSVLMW